MQGRAARLFVPLAAALASACATPPRAGVFDGHNDFAIHYAKATPAWSLQSLDVDSRLPGQGDVPRWRSGGVVGMLATVASDRPAGSPAHFDRLLASLDWMDRLVARHRSLTKVGSSADYRRAVASGATALVPAIEGGDQLDYSLDNLRRAYGQGLRSIGLVYDHHNRFGDGAMVQQGSSDAATAANGGLTPLGRQWIAELNRLGVLVDLSHASERTALQAMQASAAPVIFSHSGARALADTPRNLSDEALRALARNGGIVMVTFVPYVTTSEHWRWYDAGEREYARLVAEHGEDSGQIDRGMADWDRDNPQPAVTIADVADQIEHVAQVAGHAHVGIGSDFDGMGSFTIPELGDASRIPALFAELRRRGWSETRLDALASGNFLRVWETVERRAAAAP